MAVGKPEICAHGLVQVVNPPAVGVTRSWDGKRGERPIDHDKGVCRVEGISARIIRIIHGRDRCIKRAGNDLGKRPVRQKKTMVV